MLKIHATVKKYKLSKYFEVLTGLIGLTVVNLLFFRSDPGFINVAPHPYWIVILLTASRYGFSGGAFAGIAASVFFLLFRTLALPDLAMTDFKSLAMWGKPILFFLVGVVIGEMRELNIKEYNKVCEVRDAYKDAFDKIKVKFDVLSEAKQEVDSKILSQESTLGTLYEAAQGLRTLDMESIYPAVLEILREFMDVDDCSIYRLEGTEFKLDTAIRHGKSFVPETVPFDEGLMGLAAAHKKTVSIREVASTESMPSGIIISAPILADNQRHVVGVLNVEKMPFLKFTSDSLRITGLVADWCGSSVENATVFKETKHKLIADEIIDAYTYDYFKRRLKEEFMRARRYELDLSLIMLEFPSLSNASDEGREEVLMAFSMILKNQIREIDILFISEKPGAFFMLLPTTPPAGARVVVNNLLNSFKALSVMAFETDQNLVELRAGVAGYTIGMEDPMELVKSVEEDVVSVLFAE
ncbi:sensor domain-containing diguanylate cyclase [Maridesulfovibrio hydrothermalis]|uniref:Diguanylate cyclase with GAF sensor n=1 Tax=Maridesulfovibrio hydrothermalis AM13 = DSM 14728 TaxID=1121451 RepID=L0REX7_9BACT|nr:GAF domain-containing protein [Maridesulfovibrio hydrothermalis]CCO24106.1 Diguanylate cyclase with GAF sensor [Maridesulfovibrio hydrothermalis AM13 = DSM 14728]